MMISIHLSFHPKFSITGLVKDEKTGSPIEGAVVQLIASDGSNLQAETGAGGALSSH